MAESRVPSQKGEDRAKMSRAIWSNVKTQSWTRIIKDFKEKTKILYGEIQLKNQWDGMKKQYNALTTLCGQTGVGLNKATTLKVISF